MFSATWPKEVRQLAQKFLSSNRIHVTIGNEILAANPSICQIIEVCNESQKENRFVRFRRGRFLSISFFSNRFLQLIGQIMALRDGKTLVFCQTKRRVDEIYRLTKQMGFPVVSFLISRDHHLVYFFSFAFMVINNNLNVILLWVNFAVDEK